MEMCLGKSARHLWIITCILVACAVPPRVHHPGPAPVAEALDRSKAIDLYLGGRTLAPIEGIWVWDNNQYEVAIVRNTSETNPEYQYLGLVTDTQQSNWRRGEVKLLLKETASPGVLTGTYLMGNKSRHGTTFFLTNPNLIELSLPSGFYGSQERLFLIRIFPKGQTPEGTTARGEGSAGTGFFVAPEVLATNFHIVADATRITLRIRGTEVKGEVLLQDPQNDLALIKLASSADLLVTATLKASTLCLPLGDPDKVKAGDRVYALGFPLSGVLGSSISVSEGLVNNTVGLQDDPRMFQVSVPIQPGSSGSPLFDPNGEVVGIITSTLNNKFLFATQGVVPQNVNFAIKTSYLRSMLALVPGGTCPASERSAGVALTPRDLQERFSGAVVRVEVAR